MENIPQQPNGQVPQKGWFSMHHTGTTIVVALGVLLIASTIAWAQHKNQTQTANSCVEGSREADCRDTKICIQVVTWATNRETNETKQFPTPCDVPEGWVLMAEEPEANVKTYTNSEFGFEMQYPESWAVKVLEKGSLVTAEAVRIAFMQGNVEKLIFEGDYHDYSYAESHVGFQGKQKIGNLTFDTVGGSTSLFFIKGAGGRGYHFEVKKMDSEIESVISSLKFVDSETANWKIHTNSEFRFELKYPETELLEETPNVDWVVLALHDREDRQRFNFTINVDQPGMGFEGYNIVSRSTVAIDGVKANKQILEVSDGHEKGTKVVLFIFMKDNHEYLIQASGEIERADEILSTLRFN